MTLLSTVQNSFASGEIDPRLVAQSDIKAYSQGVKRARNVARLATGGFERRYGTYDLAWMVGKSRLAGFEFSEAQRYLLGFSEGKVEIYDLNGELLQTITGCPWDETEAFEMTLTQQGDVMEICHTAFWTRELIRTSATTFTLGLFTFDSEAGGNKSCQPFYKFAAPDVTISPSAVTGAGITLTASAAHFVAAHVGTRFKLQGVEVEITGYTDSTHVTATVKGTLKVKLDPDPFKTKIGSTTVEVTHVYHGYATGASVTFSGSNDAGGIANASINGARTITVIDEHTYSFTAGAAATASEDGGGSNVEVSAANVAMRDWGEQVFSDVRGYPGACGFHEGRLCFGGTLSQPDGEWLSKSLSYRNFDVGTGQDGDSVQVAVGTEDISRIRHIVSNSELQLLTATRELVHVQPSGEPITPTNVRIKSQSIAGCGPVQPVVFDGATLFIQENGHSVSELTYSNEQGGYLAVPVSTLAGHLINEPTSLTASAGVTSRAEQFALMSNADGTIAVFQSLRSENLAGWMLWELGAGECQSIEAVGPYIFLCVEVRGQYRLYRLATDEIVSLDGAVLHTSAVAKTSWTLDPRVRNRTVSLVSELGYHGDFSIPSNGVVELDVAVTQLVAGDDYRFTIETLPPEVALSNGSRTRMVKRLVRTILELYNAHAITVDGKRIDTLTAGDDWAGAINPMTGAYEYRHLGFARQPTVTISQDAPLPATVLGYTQEVKV